MRGTSKLRRLGIKKSQLLQLKKQEQEKYLQRFYIVSSEEEAEKIMHEHFASGIKNWQPLIIVNEPKRGEIHD